MAQIPNSRMAARLTTIKGVSRENIWGAAGSGVPALAMCGAGQAGWWLMLNGAANSANKGWLWMLAASFLMR